MIGDALDSDLDNVYAWGRLLGSGQESPQSFFAKNASAVSVALLKRDGKTDTVKAESIHLNEALSKDYGVTEAEMISLLQSDKSDEFFNASPDVLFSARLCERMVLCSLYFRSGLTPKIPFS